jgi:hypothetical protein
LAFLCDPQLFGWRHQARRGELAGNSEEKPAFVPAVADGFLNSGGRTELFGTTGSAGG